MIQSEITEARQLLRVYRERTAVEHYVLVLGTLGFFLSLPLAFTDLPVDWRFPCVIGAVAAWGFFAKMKARRRAAELEAVVAERRAALSEHGAR